MSKPQWRWWWVVVVIDQRTAVVVDSWSTRRRLRSYHSFYRIDSRDTVSPLTNLFGLRWRMVYPVYAVGVFVYVWGMIGACVWVRVYSNYSTALELIMQQLCMHICSSYDQHAHMHVGCGIYNMYYSILYYCLLNIIIIIIRSNNHHHLIENRKWTRSDRDHSNHIWRLAPHASRRSCTHITSHTCTHIYIYTLTHTSLCTELYAHPPMWMLCLWLVCVTLIRSWHEKA